jgi:hypothetical protein
MIGCDVICRWKGYREQSLFPFKQLKMRGSDYNRIVSDKDLHASTGPYAIVQPAPWIPCVIYHESARLIAAMQSEKPSGSESASWLAN